MNDEFTAYLREQAESIERFAKHIRDYRNDPESRSLVVELTTGVRITFREPLKDLSLHVPFIERVMDGAIVVEPVE